MKRTQALDARRNIRKEIIAYLSIVIIGMLATLAYLGIAYSAATLKKDALNFFNSNEFWDIEITSTMLMDEDDLSAVRALPGVKEVESVYQIDTKLLPGGSNSAVTIISLPEKISMPVLREGRLPEKATECAVEKKLLEEHGLSIGQQITVESSLIAGVDPLLEKSFVITGIFQTPDHFTYMIQVTPYILVCKESFNREELDGAFMKTRVRVEGTPGNRYSDAFWDVITPVYDALKALGEERAPVRREKVYGTYEEQIRDGEAQLEEAAEQLRQARETLDAGQADLEAAAEQLGLMKELLDYGGQLLADATRQIKQGASQLQEYRRILESVHGYLKQGKDWILENITENVWPAETGVSYAEFIRVLDSGEISVMNWLYEKSGYNSGEQLLHDALKKLESGRNDWYFSGEEYLDGLALFERGKKQLEDGERELAEGQEKYDAAEKELQEAREKLEQIGECRWAVLNNYGNPGFAYAETNSDKLASLSTSFSIIFLVVGALVIYATISRMVEQQRKLVGATKAMGLYNREIFAKYLYFACSAVFLGIGFGIFLSWLPLQRVILRSYEALFSYGTGTRSFLPLETGLVTGGSLILSVIAVYLGCSQLLRLPAIRLMQGDAPAVSRKKARRSAEKSLFSRLILRNMRTDWSRVLVTTVCIAGGCVLMVIGFTLRYGISGVTTRQFGGVLTYEAEVFYNTGENADAAREIETILEQNSLPHVSACKRSSAFDVNGTLSSLTMIVAEKGSLEGYYTLRDVRNGENFDLPDAGALAPRRFWEYYGIGVGEPVTVYDTGMNQNQIRLAGVFENYYGQIFFMTPQGYMEAFESEPEDNCFFVKTNGMSLEELQQKIAGISGFESVNDAAAERNTIEQFTASLNFVVWLMLFIAGMMACFIVANFTMTYIQRKSRELVIMRINGFSIGKCIRYTAMDLVITTIFGILLGLVFGRIIGYRILRVTETPYIQMVRDPSVQSFLYSALITCGFSVITNGYALRRVKYLKLSDLT